MPRNHTTWAAISVDADQSPPLMLLREELGETGDVYFYRAVAWCKRFCREGEIDGRWPQLALCLRWPREYGVERLRDLFRASGCVFGPRDELYGWEDTNAWIIRKQERERLRGEARRKAGRASAKARRKAAKARKLLAATGKSAEKDSKLSVSGWVGGSGDPRSVRGRSADAKPKRKR